MFQIQNNNENFDYKNQFAILRLNSRSIFDRDIPDILNSFCNSYQNIAESKANFENAKKAAEKCHNDISYAVQDINDEKNDKYFINCMSILSTLIKYYDAKITGQPFVFVDKQKPDKDDQYRQNLKKELTSYNSHTGLCYITETGIKDNNDTAYRDAFRFIEKIAAKLKIQDMKNNLIDLCKQYNSNTLWTRDIKNNPDFSIKAEKDIKKALDYVTQKAQKEITSPNYENLFYLKETLRLVYAFYAKIVAQIKKNTPVSTSTIETTGTKTQNNNTTETTTTDENNNQDNQSQDTNKEVVDPATNQETEAEKPTDVIENKPAETEKTQENPAVTVPEQKPILKPKVIVHKKKENSPSANKKNAAAITTAAVAATTIFVVYNTFNIEPLPLMDTQNTMNFSFETQISSSEPNNQAV